MSLSELSIRRPIMTTLITLSFIIFGVFAYKKLPVSALPRVDYPTINVSAQLPGASPETMASSVAATLERQFSTISGITSMSSISQLGSTSITMQFDLDRSIDGAALDVQSAISATLRRLPTELPAPPSFRKVNPADQPILFLTLTSDSLPLSTVNEYAENVLQQQISQILGVAQVQIFGAQKYAVRIFFDPDALAVRGLTAADLRTAVANANSNSPVGQLRSPNQRVTIEATGQMTRADEYKDVVVAARGGAGGQAVKLQDVARAVDSVENDQTAAWYNGARSVTIAIYRQSDANTVETVDRIKEKLPFYREQLPPSVNLTLLNDRSVPIKEAVEDVQFTLGLSVVLVILVIYVFLKRLSATVIPTLALPVSLIGTFAFMYLFGYTLDNISLLALTLAVGFVVDDAIVMLENIVRHIEMGKKPFEAALVGAKEIGFTILSITFSLIAVFIPVFFMSGVVGRIFREFAATISVSILVSGFVSLTLTPMLCARFLKPEDHNRKPNLFDRIVDGGFNAILTFYRVTLDWTLRHRLFVLVLTFGSAWWAMHLYSTIPKGFFPIEDTGLLRAATEGPSDTSFEAMAARQQQLIEIVRKDPAVESVNANVGGFSSTNQGFMFITLKPKNERDDIQTIIGRLRNSTSQVPGITFVAGPVQNLNLNAGRQSRAMYQYTLTGPNLQELIDVAPRHLQSLRALPELRDVSLDLQLRNPQMKIDIDREQAQRMGVSVAQIKSSLYNAFGGGTISTIYTSSSDYPVILEAERSFQAQPDALSRLYIRSQNTAVAPAQGTATQQGNTTQNASTTVSNISAVQNIPLDSLVKVTPSVGPLAVNRVSQMPAVTISFNTAPGVSLGEAVEAIRKVERSANFPASINTRFAGSAQLFQEALAGQDMLLIAAILVIYILLGVLYESFIHPITILSGLPSAGLGALLALKYFNMDLSVIAIIGILMLIGIVKKNAIMMVDFALERRREGDDAMSAIREAALVRFRPILMTTLAAALGALPIALAHGAGAELRQPLGIAVVGGLAVSQVMTLYITPVIYYYLDKVDTFFRPAAIVETEGDTSPALSVIEHPVGEEAPATQGSHVTPKTSAAAPSIR
ncbi:MAG: efflux RND transporter permease subunit [Proteobacteria bacterium]|nr:efflux RND transporter permease subunit [Pseudomonadota bacterium]